MPQWISEGSLEKKKRMSPIFRTILLKETLENVDYIKTHFLDVWYALLCHSWFYAFFSSSCLILFWSFFGLSDLDNFKTQTARSAVNVREGQGVVLLCGPPAHSGGKFAISGYAAFMPAVSYWNMTHRKYLNSFHMATFDKGLLPYSELNLFLHPYKCRRS